MDHYEEMIESLWTEFCRSEGMADREYAREVGRTHSDRAWILSDRDVWYPNSFYQGPPQPHPEDYEVETAP